MATCSDRFTVPLSALHFGTVSLAALLTNLFVLWLMPVCFIGSYLAAFAGLIWPLAGQALAWAVAWPMRYVLAAAELLSRLPEAALSAENPLIVLWLVFVYVLFAVTYCLSERGKYRPVLPVCCCVCALCAVVMLTVWSTVSTPRVTALDVGQGQSIVFLSGNNTVMVDCGGNGAVTNAGDTAAQYLQSVGRNTVDVLVLTHPHEDHVNGVLRLLKQVRVRMLVVPEAADADREPLQSILALIAQARLEVPETEHDRQKRLQAKKARPVLPFVQLRSQLWLREMRRLVASVAKTPRLVFADDVAVEDREHYLPVIHCRDCHATGWASLRHGQSVQLETDLDGIYRQFFEKGRSIVLAFPDNNEKAVSGAHQKLCPTCLKLNRQSSVQCGHCGHTELLQVLIPDMLKERKDELEFANECPYCNSKSIRVFEDTRGHVQTKCKVCGKETVFDVLSMRRVSFRRIS